MLGYEFVLSLLNHVGGRWLSGGEVDGLCCASETVGALLQEVTPSGNRLC